MGHTVLGFVIMLVPYLLGFVIPLSARTWRGWTIRLVMSIVLFLAMLSFLRFGPGLVAFAFAFPVSAFALATLIGHVAKVFFLWMKWPRTSLKAVAVALVGISLLPGYMVASNYYWQARSRSIYASLPTAHELPALSACNAFRDAGPLLDTVLTVRPGETRPATIPATDLAIRYAAAYRDPSRPFLPDPKEKTYSLNLEMYVGDAQPAPPGDDLDASGRLIPLSDRQPSVHFRFASRFPVAMAATRQINSMAGAFDDLNRSPALQLAPSGFGNLSAIVGPAAGGLDKFVKSFVAIEGGQIAELVQCRYPGKFSQCEFKLDASGIPVEGYFAQASLTEWNTIRTNIRNFAECSLAAAPKGGA